MNLINISASQIQDTMARLSYFAGWEKDQLVRLSAGARQIAIARKETLANKGAASTPCSLSSAARYGYTSRCPTALNASSLWLKREKASANPA